MKTFEEALEEAKSELYQSQEVKTYFALKEAVEKDEELQELLGQLRNLQKEMTLAVMDEEKHQKLKQRYLIVKKQYDDHPMIQNYKNVREQVYQLLLQAKAILEKE